MFGRSTEKAAVPRMLSGGAFADTRPNVILVMADDMGWAQTGYYGHPVLKTPNLDDMAGSGLRMDRFYAGAPSCTPTRASVLTGRTNDRTGAFRVGHSINKQEKMLSTAFRDAGYSTAHFGKWHLNQVGAQGHPLPADDPHSPGQLGFDYWLSATSGFDRFDIEGGRFELSDNGGTPNIDYPSECSASIDPDLTSEEARAFGCYRRVRPDSTGHLRGFKKDFYEGGLREPTIVEWPAGIEPRVSNFPAGTADIFPTLIDVAGLSRDSINKGHDGISLMEVFKSEPGRGDQPLGFRASDGRMWLDNDHYQDFPSTAIATRPADVWLPEDYGAGSADRYPVVYMHDGQFMFDRSHSPYAGTDWLWDVDKTMTRLTQEGEIRPAIVVSVWMYDEKKVSRRAEYMPQKMLTAEVRQRDQAAAGLSGSGIHILAAQPACRRTGTLRKESLSIGSLTTGRLPDHIEFTSTMVPKLLMPTMDPINCRWMK